MEIIDKIVIAFVFSVIIESIVNLLFEDIPQAKIKKYIAIVIGIAMTIAWKIGIISAMQIAIPNTFAMYVDFVFSGIFISRGSNYLHQLWESLKIYRETKIALMSSVAKPLDKPPEG